MKCPYETPFSTPELPNVAGEFWIYDANHRPLFYVDKKEQADYIVQAINSHKKLVKVLENFRFVIDLVLKKLKSQESG